MRNLQGSTDTALDQSMGRKAARLAAKPHVVGSIALDERLRGGAPAGPMVLDEGMITNSVFNSRGGWIHVSGGVAPYRIESPDSAIGGRTEESGRFGWNAAAMGPTPITVRDSSPEPFELNFIADWTGMGPDSQRPLAPVPAGAGADPVTGPGSFPWDTMTTHAQIDGWADANGVVRGADWGQMTLASKRQWLVAYFDGARPWEAGN